MDSGHVWRWLGDNSGRLLAVLAVVGIGANVVTGAIQGWLKFPLPIKVAGVIGVIALLALLVRTRQTWWPWLKDLLRPKERASPPAGPSQTMVHQESGSSATLAGNLQQQFVGGLQQAANPPPIPSTPALLRRRLEELRDLNRRLAMFFAAQAPGLDTGRLLSVDYQATLAAVGSWMGDTQATLRLYVQQFDAEVVATYEELRLRGFSDDQLDHMVGIPAMMPGGGPPQLLPIIAQRLGVLARQMERRLTDMESEESQL